MAKINIKNILIPTPVFFIVAIFFILFFLPREGKYKYMYSENKPWQYGLLTAPFNFHIQKSEEAVNREKDSIMQSFQPYYMIDATIERKASSQFTQDARANSIPQEDIAYITRKMSELYKAGIMAANNYEKIQETDRKQLRLKNENNIAVTRHLPSFYTPKLAYEKILADKPSHVNLSHLKGLNINDYLYPNIIEDEKTSEKVKEELLKEVGLFEGMVQSGEKIIDRGEIVNPHTKDILDSYTMEMEKRMGTKVNPGWLILGQFVMVSLLIMALLLYLRFFRIREYNNRKNVIFMLLSVTVMVIMTCFVVEYKIESLLYVIPFALPTILIRTFIDSRTAMTTHMITVLLAALMVSLPADFIVIQVMVGFMCIFSLRKLAERSQLIYAGIFILLTYMVTYTGWTLCSEGEISEINLRMYLYFCINFVFVSFAYLLVYVCEKVFGFISEVSMIELSNTNRPLLQQLSEIAPGTFQHSMQVSNLVVSAANRIGANAPLVRTGALYHDIGKMINPAFFTENQSEGMNPHAGLSEKESARIIIGHVAEGVKLAKKFRLPQQIVDFIETHHGRGKVKYFYNTYVNNHPDEVVDEADFMYPGPNPFSRETALLMMADTVEAASRSLKEYTKESITDLVNRLIDDQVNDGLFKNAPITFKDIELAKEVFCDKLIIMNHTRISYPVLNKEEETTTK